MGPISKKVIAGLKKAKNQKIIDFNELKEAKEYAEDLDKTVASKDDLSKRDPLHAVYIYAQNKVSVLVEQLADLPALSKLTNTLDQADDIYLPSFPPKSPLTQSYFTCWGFFDLCVGIKKEFFGTVIIDLLKHLKTDSGLIKMVECMQNSRMGIFIHKGHMDRYVILEELVTGKEIKVIVPSGYQGKRDEIWYARVMPEPFPDLNYGYSLVFTTPYILINIDGSRGSSAKRDDWEAFFDRNLKAAGKKDKIKAYESFMKYGKNKYFWNEYIFKGYVNYQEDMIMLAGFPDIPLSMPHSEKSQKEQGRDIKTRTFNRTAITILPKKPYVDWINSFEDVLEYDDNIATTILIPDKYDEIDYEIYLKKNLKKLFEDQLGSWTTNIDVWPKKRDYKTFKKWFDVLCSDMTWDYGDGDIEHDED